ncbi:MAG: family transporter [Gemmatimonadetes bacterium]|nr:family transporter [Gemmatimonadota bacterium]
MKDGSRGAEAAVIILATLGVLVALSYGRPVLVPLALALVISTTLRPLVRGLEGWGLHPTAASAVVIIAMLAVLAGIGLAISTPAQKMAEDAPASFAKARTKVMKATARLRRLNPESIVNAAPSGGAASKPSVPAPATSITAAVGATAALATETVEVVLLAFFILAMGDKWMRKLIATSDTLGTKRRALEIAGEMSDVVARYLFVTLLINAGQSVLIGLALWAIGVPTPWLWASLTFVAEFVPYLGGLVMIALLLVAGLAADSGVSNALLPPAVYLVVTTLQNNLVSPVAYGKGLRLNPTMILLSVMFWWMLWGVAGAFLAVPILASMRVLGASLPSLENLGILLEE